MRMIEIVAQLISQGHKIKYRVRTDGGIIITQIDKRKFTRAGSGNVVAREMTGVRLSEARRVQTQYNVEHYIKLTKSHPHKASSLNDDYELKKLTRKVQRYWNTRKVVGEGKVTIRKVRWLQQHKGVEEAKLYLANRLHYAQGYAYSENVLFWSKVLERIGVQYGMEKEFEELSAILLSKDGIVKETDLQDIHDIYYEKGKSGEQKYQEIKKIIDAIK